jgi:hypothetical protein
LALLIAGLWLRWKHVRYTGEAAYSLRAWLSENTTLPGDTREVCSESEWGVAAYALIQEKLKVPDARWRVPDTSYLFYLSLVNKLLLLRKR